jgi:hypothetical protein
MNFLSLKEIEFRLKETDNPEWIERATPLLKEAFRQWRHLHSKSASRSPQGKEMASVHPSPYSKMLYSKKARPKVTFTGRQTDAQGRQTCFRGGKHAPCEEFGGQNQGWTGVEQEHLQKEGEKDLETTEIEQKKPKLPEKVGENPQIQQPEQPEAEERAKIQPNPSKVEGFTEEQPEQVKTTEEPKKPLPSSPSTKPISKFKISSENAKLNPYFDDGYWEEIKESIRGLISSGSESSIQTQDITQDQTAGILASFVGAPPNSTIQVFDVSQKSGGRYTTLDVTNPMFKNCVRTLLVRSNGTKEIRNEELVLKPQYRNNGEGSNIFYAQVQNAAAYGFSEISTSAGSGRDMNGVTTWPLLGYDASIQELFDGLRNPESYDYFKRIFPNAYSISEIIESPEVPLSKDQLRQVNYSLASLAQWRGLPYTKKNVVNGRDWWKAFIQQSRHLTISVDMTFNLHEGSTSRRILEAYMKQRQRRTKAMDMPKEDYEDINLAPWEEEALERAWDSLDKQTYGQKGLPPLPDQTETTLKSPPKVPQSRFHSFFHEHKALGERKAPPAPGKYPSDLNVSKVTSNPLPNAHPPGEQPPPVPENSVQHGAPDTAALQQIERLVGERGQGTGLAHEIRAHQVDASILQQFQAHGVASLTDLSSFLRQQGEADSANLTEFHDDESPFVVLSQPQQQISGQNAPSVVVGKPYDRVIHLLEEAFPGVHFLPVEEAANQLKEAAQSNPLPAAKSFGQKSNSVVDNTNTKLPRMPSHQTQSTSKPGGAQQQPQQAPTQAPQAVQPVQQAIPAPLAQTQSTTHFQPQIQQPVEQSAQPLNQASVEPIQQIEAPLTGTQDSGALNLSPEGPNAYYDYASASLYGEKMAEQAQKLYEQQGLPYEEAASLAKDAYNQAVDEWNQARWNEKGMNEAPLPEGETLTSLTTEIGRFLSTAPEVKKEKLGKGENGAWNVEVEGGYRGVQKLGRDEAFDAERTTGIKSGTMYRREIATSSVAKAILGDKFNLVPETVLRLQNGAPGSMQSYVENFRAASEVDSKIAYGNNREALQWAWVLDYLTGNTDRHLGNHGINESGELVLIDNGLSMPSRTARFERMFEYRAANILAQGITKDIKLPDVASIKDKWATLEKIFIECGIDERAINLAKYRWNDLVLFSGRACRDVPSLSGNTTMYGMYTKQIDLLKARGINA